MDRQEAIDQILDHFHNPRNRGDMPGATFSAEGINPGCGDVVKMYVRLNDDGRIAAATFEGQGCTISQAAASMMTEMALGKTSDEIMAMEGETLVEMLGHEIVTTRVGCGTLPLDALKEGIRQFRGDDAPRSNEV